jgi:hypothetical protein
VGLPGRQFSSSELRVRIATIWVRIATKRTCAWSTGATDDAAKRSGALIAATQHGSQLESVIPQEPEIVEPETSAQVPPQRLGSIDWDAQGGA